MSRRASVDDLRGAGDVVDVMLDIDAVQIAVELNESQRDVNRQLDVAAVGDLDPRCEDLAAHNERDGGRVDCVVSPLRTGRRTQLDHRDRRFERDRPSGAVDTVDGEKMASGET